MLPEVGSGFWPFKTDTIMAMPKTAIHKYNGVVTRQDNIWVFRVVHGHSTETENPYDATGCELTSQVWYFFP
jgi:hypothetical protein